MTPVTAEKVGYKVKCTGSEMSLDECKVYATARCESTMAAGVSCSSKQIQVKSIKSPIFVRPGHRAARRDTT